MEGDWKKKEKTEMEGKPLEGLKRLEREMKEKRLKAKLQSEKLAAQLELQRLQLERAQVECKNIEAQAKIQLAASSQADQRKRGCTDQNSYINQFCGWER